MRRVSTRVLPDPAGPRWPAGGPAGDGGAGPRRGRQQVVEQPRAGSIDEAVRQYDRAVIDVDEDTFEELVGDALDGIPDELARLMDNVAVMVEDGRATRACSACTEGVPLTERDAYGLWRCPTASRSTGCRSAPAARPRTEVVEQVRITVVHEVAHHFGIDDHRLTELGWG